MMVSMPVNRLIPPLSDDELLTAFANLGHSGPDELEDAAALRTWWVGLGAEVPTTAPDPADLELLRAVRRTVQDLALANNGVPTEVDASALETVPLRFDLASGPGLRVATGSGLVEAVAGAVVSALLRASARPDWRRLKACPGPGCAWVFRDGTRNGSRRWCLMSECGNRAKGAAFRARAAARP